jgi:diguanylate cyclase (GGDEF)-like protein
VDRGPNGEKDKTVVIFEPGRRDGVELSSAVEATLRHASEAYRVVVAGTEEALSALLASTEPVLLIVDADRCGAEDFERLVVSVRNGGATRCLPVLAMVTPSRMPVLQETLRLPPVDFILKPFESDELWGRIRVNLHQAALVADLRSQNEELVRRSVIDSLTGLFNVGHIVERCDQEIARAKRHGHVVSCLLMDVDRFKAINDTYGHPVGNEVLRELAALINGSVRRSDLVGRYGGEEFLLVLPETGREGAVALAERLRRTVEGTIFRVGPHEIRLTVSIGVATFPGPGIIGRETLLMAVDRASYRAKALGRNRVAGPEDEAGDGAGGKPGRGPGSGRDAGP